MNNKKLFNNKIAKGLVSLITIIVLLSSILATSFVYQNNITANVIRETTQIPKSATITITEVNDIEELSQLNEGWYEIRNGFVFYLDTFNSYVPLYIRVKNLEQQNGLLVVDANGAIEFHNNVNRLNEKEVVDKKYEESTQNQITGRVSGLESVSVFQVKSVIPQVPNLKQPPTLIPKSGYIKSIDDTIKQNNLKITREQALSLFAAESGLVHAVNLVIKVPNPKNPPMEFVNQKKEEYGDKYGVNTNFVVPLYKKSSSGTPEIESVSVGPAQLNEKYYTETQLKNPIENIKAGTKFFGQLYDYCGEHFNCAVRAYNQGPALLEKSAKAGKLEVYLAEADALFAQYTNEGLQNPTQLLLGRSNQYLAQFQSSEGQSLLSSTSSFLTPKRAEASTPALEGVTNGETVYVNGVPYRFNGLQPKGDKYSLSPFDNLAKVIELPKNYVGVSKNPPTFSTISDAENKFANSIGINLLKQYTVDEDGKVHDQNGIVVAQFNDEARSFYAGKIIYQDIQVKDTGIRGPYSINYKINILDDKNKIIAIQDINLIEEDDDGNVIKIAGQKAELVDVTFVLPESISADSINFNTGAIYEVGDNYMLIKDSSDIPIYVKLEKSQDGKSIYNWEDFQNKGLYRFIEGQQLETFDYESGFWIQSIFDPRFSQAIERTNIDERASVLITSEVSQPQETQATVFESVISSAETTLVKGNGFDVVEVDDRIFYATEDGFIYEMTKNPDGTFKLQIENDIYKVDSKGNINFQFSLQQLFAVIDRNDEELGLLYQQALQEAKTQEDQQRLQQLFLALETIDREEGQRYEEALAQAKSLEEQQRLQQLYIAVNALDAEQGQRFAEALAEAQSQEEKQRLEQFYAAVNALDAEQGQRFAEALAEAQSQEEKTPQDKPSSSSTSQISPTTSSSNSDIKPTDYTKTEKIGNHNYEILYSPGGNILEIGDKKVNINKEMLNFIKKNIGDSQLKIADDGSVSFSKESTKKEGKEGTDPYKETTVTSVWKYQGDQYTKTTTTEVKDKDGNIITLTEIHTQFKYDYDTKKEAPLIITEKTYKFQEGLSSINENSDYILVKYDAVTREPLEVEIVESGQKSYAKYNPETKQIEGDKKVAEQLQTLRTQHTIRTYFAEAERVLTEFQGLGYYATLFFDEDSLLEWRDSVDKIFATFYLGTEYWSSAICGTYLDGEDEGIAYAETPQGLAQVGAHIEATRSEPIQAINATEFIYKITFNVRNGDYDKDPRAPEEININVVLKGQRTANVFKQEQKVKRGSSFGRTGRNAIVQDSNVLYTEVCLTFDRIPLRWKLDNGELCNTIQESSGEATTVAITTNTTTAGGGGATGDINDF